MIAAVALKQCGAKICTPPPAAPTNKLHMAFVRPHTGNTSVCVFDG